MLILAACGGDDGDGGADLEPPECAADSTLRYVHDVGGTTMTGEMAFDGYAFFNKVSDDPGSFTIGNGNEASARIEFERLVVDGGTVAARGFVKLGGLDVGNCATAALAGSLTDLGGDGWTFVLADLHEAPYCEGAAVSGSFAACFVPTPR